MEGTERNMKKQRVSRGPTSEYNPKLTALEGNTTPLIDRKQAPPAATGHTSSSRSLEPNDTARHLKKAF